MKRDQSIFPPLGQNQSNSANRLVVLSDLAEFKLELLAGIKVLLKELSGQPNKRWVKTNELREILDMSPGTLQTLRNNGTFPFTKIGGVVYYDIEEIKKILSPTKSRQL